MNNSDKRGFSKVVTTILIILLAIAAIATVWAAVNKLILNGKNQITLGDIGLDVQINSVFINSTNGSAEVKVTRNKGIADLKINRLRFIVEDPNNADTFDVPVQNFQELAKRTIYLNLTEHGILDPENIIKISVAPIYVSDTTGKDTVSPITSATQVGVSNQTVIKILTCQENSDCGTDTFISGTKFCSSSSQVSQYKDIYECFGAPDGFCQKRTDPVVVESCAGSDVCLNGACQPPDVSCTPENVSQDCGVSGYIGYPSCSVDGTSIVQDYDSFECINNTCSESIISQKIKDCSPPQVCGVTGGTAQCFEPVECTVNSDCTNNPNFGPGYICTNGNCTQEIAALNGTVSSSWPPGLNEYFDSPDLPSNSSTSTVDYKGYTIIFPRSTQRECLTVKDYVYPPKDSYNAYIQLSSPRTNVTTGDYFELWETSYGCVVLNNSL